MAKRLAKASFCDGLTACLHNLKSTKIESIPFEI